MSDLGRKRCRFIWNVRKGFEMVDGGGGGGVQGRRRSLDTQLWRANYYH
jgi:hypothetical protein